MKYVFFLHTQKEIGKLRKVKKYIMVRKIFLFLYCSKKSAKFPGEELTVLCPQSLPPNI